MEIFVLHSNITAYVQSLRTHLNVDLQDNTHVYAHFKLSVCHSEIMIAYVKQIRLQITANHMVITYVYADIILFYVKVSLMIVYVERVIVCQIYINVYV